ncbi:MAG: SH3 domain-containing protein [Bdellovibrionales bacterium]|nr:SH3 domain-containing protein [Bdellovibrionales bacterium]
MIFSLFALAICPKTQAQSPSPSSALQDYQEGIKLYQQHQLPQAQEKFLLALAKAPHNKFILYNLGLTDFQLDKKGRALGAWRMAIYLDPYFSLARQALDYAHRQMGNLSGGPHSNWESFRKDILQWISLELALALTAFFLLVSGFILIRYWSLRLQALAEDKVLPAFPYLGSLFGLLFVICGGLAVFRGFDFITSRATLVSKIAQVHSGPNAEDVSLFELLEGQEVIIRKVSKNWVQIRYPGGLTGWVPKDVLFHSSGQTPW